MACAYLVDSQGILRKELYHWSTKASVWLSMLGQQYHNSFPDSAPLWLQEKVVESADPLDGFTVVAFTAHTLAEAITKPHSYLQPSEFAEWLEYMQELERRGESPTLYLLITEWT